MSQSLPHFKPGFTLIELMVSVTLISLLVSFGISAYTKSQQRQVIRTATAQLADSLDSLHQQALIGKRPDTCTGAFQGYLVETDPNTNQFTATAQCALTNSAEETITINNLTFVNNDIFTFAPLTGGIDMGGATNLNLDYLDVEGTTHRFILSRGGSIEYLGALE